MKTCPVCGKDDVVSYSKACLGRERPVMTYEHKGGSVCYQGGEDDRDDGPGGEDYFSFRD